MRLRFLLSLIVLSAPLADAKGVRVAFSPGDPQIGPFPTDFLTVPDARQKTGRRVAMPLPDCATQSAVCAQLTLINEFDGFAVQPRVRVRFTGAVDPATLRNGIFLFTLDKLTKDEYELGPAGHVVLINEVVYDPATNTAYAKPDEALDQTRRYAIIVNSGVRDLAGDPVESDPGFTACTSAQDEYCASVRDAVRRVPQPANPSGQPNIVAASVFTTMSATAWLESARRQMQTVNPSFARPAGKGIFTPGEISKIELRSQIRTSGDKFAVTELPFPMALLGQLGLGRIAFGSFQSARFLGPALAIATTPTAEPAAAPTQTEEIPFQVYLPSGAKPAGGYPVVMVGHGFGGSRMDVPTAMIPGLVGSGFAVIGINAVGHGFGPESTLEITDRGGTKTVLPFGGRGADVNGDGRIEPLEGAVFFAAQQPLGIRDGLRQTALDYMQLARAIRSGMDLDGDGSVDLARDQVQYLGVSLGSFYGTLLAAVEPDVPSAVLNVGGGSGVGTALLSSSFRELLRIYLGARSPSLLNKGNDFDANLPLRYEPVRVNDVPGAIAIQEDLERLEWIETPGAPHAYAPHLKSATLKDVPIKRVLFQFAVGDTTVPNPQNLLLLRSANMWDSASMFRADVVRQTVPLYLRNPHSFLAQIDQVVALPYAVAGQIQAAQFLKGVDGVPPAPGDYQKYFEPVTLMLEKLNFAPAAQGAN